MCRTIGGVRGIFCLEASVYPDRMDFVGHSNEAVGWEKTREAMERIRDELNRQLSQGEAKCPFAPNTKAIVTQVYGKEQKQ